MRSKIFFYFSGIIFKITCFKDVSIIIINAVYDIFYNINNILELDHELFFKAKYEFQDEIRVYLDKTNQFEIVEKEVFNKIIKWNITNKFDIIDYVK